MHIIVFKLLVKYWKYCSGRTVFNLSVDTLKHIPVIHLAQFTHKHSIDKKIN